MPAVDANGIKIEYDTTGAGDPLLLVMGLGGQLTDWHPDFVAELASAGFQVITFDNRDQGLSTEFDWQPPSQVSATPTPSGCWTRSGSTRRTWSGCRWVG